MTNYNDGNWHGWNGGECPVHPKSVVEWVHVCELNEWSLGIQEKMEAGQLGFNEGIIAFRVVKEYREPREFWIAGQMALAFPSSREAKTAYPGITPIHVREVTE